MTVVLISVGVDPSLEAPGFAAVDHVSGVVLRAHTLTIGPLRGAARLDAINGGLYEFIRGLPGEVHESAIEGPSLGSTHREYDLGEASGVLRQHLYSVTRKEPLVVPPALVKKFATGNGQADKEDVWEYVVRTLEYPVKPGDYDASDAAVIARIAWAYATSSRDSCETRAQAEVLHTLRAVPKPKARKRTPKDNL